MPVNKAKALSDLQESVRNVISAHEAIKQGIATHAEKRRALQQESRHAADRQARISEGAAKQNAQVRAAG